MPRDTPPEALADRLAERGVAVRAGLHCAPLAHLTAGTSETGTVRFSASAFNTVEEAEEVVAEHQHPRDPDSGELVESS